MEPLRSERVKSIFLRVAELSAPERKAALDAACAGDQELQRRVEQLLAHNDVTGTMDILPAASGGTASPVLAAGQLVSGRFRIDRRIGKGGMGEVYEARDEELRGRLALKIIRPGLAYDEEMLNRFRREVQLARQVTHPNVCRIFDVGRDTIGGQDLLYLTMEMVDGETLADLLKREGKLAPKDALPLLQQVAAGLAALHEKSIVHRDLKPANLMIVRPASGPPRVVIGDFGLARAVLEESLEDGLSRSGVVMGTPGYMAPEQLAGLRVSPATDLFAFGAVAYEVVTGRKAFPPPRTDALPPEPRQLVPDLPSGWDRAIMRCLAREPSERPESAELVAGALAGTAKLAAVPVPWPRRKLLWAVAAVAVALLAVWALMRPLPGGAAFRGGRVNQAYLEASDLLDHAYRPGASGKAIALLEPLSASPDATALVHAALGRAYFRQFRETRDADLLDKAKISSARAVALNAQLASPRVILARVFTESGKSELAAQELQEALRLDARNADAYVALAELDEKRGRMEEVEPNLQKAVDLAPDYWGGHASFGIFLRTAKRYTEAQREFLKLIDLAPDNALAYGYLGVLYFQQGHYKEARAAFEREVSLAPSSRAYTNLGAALQMEGMFDPAAEMYRKAIDLNPSEYNSWGNLGSAYLWSTGRKPEAEAAFRKAIALAEETRKTTPNNVTVIVRLGAYYASVGDAAKSIPLLRQAIALDPSGATTLLQAGEAYELLGRREDALRWIGKALELGTAPEFVNRTPGLARLRTDPRFKSLKQ